ALHADELGALAIAVLLQPVGVHQPRRVVLGVGANRSQQGIGGHGRAPSQAVPGTDSILPRHPPGSATSALANGRPLRHHGGVFRRPCMPSATAPDDLKAVIAKHWGFRELRPLQDQAMRAVLEGRDSLVVLPTGGGKSLCYQAPAVLRGGTTLV